MAWFGKWESADLVWSLWLSSLIVGYALIVWNLSATFREFTGNALNDSSPGATAMKLGGGALLGLGTLFMLAFFTVHFGGFHFVHSVFLANLFPLMEGRSDVDGFINWPLYREVVERYLVVLRRGLQDWKIVRVAITPVKGTKKIKLIEEYANFTLSPEYGEFMARTTRYAPSSKAAVKRLEPELVKDLGIDPKNVSRLTFKDIPKDKSRWNEVWNEVKAA